MKDAWLIGQETSDVYKKLLVLMEHKKNRQCIEREMKVYSDVLYISIVKAARAALMENQFLSDTIWSLRLRKESIFHYGGYRFFLETTFPRRLQEFFHKIFSGYDRELWKIPLVMFIDDKLDSKCILRPNWLGNTDNNSYIIEFFDGFISLRMKQLKSFGVKIAPKSIEYVEKSMAECLRLVDEFKEIEHKKD